MQPLPPKYKTVLNPETGKLETVEDKSESAQSSLERTRRELRDMLSGNVHFHEDKLSKFYQAHDMSKEADVFDTSSGSAHSVNTLPTNPTRLRRSET
jgi:hypothetical protein